MQQEWRELNSVGPHFPFYLAPPGGGGFLNLYVDGLVVFALWCTGNTLHFDLGSQADKPRS